MDPIQQDDKRYEPARNQEFRTFEEAEKLLRDYCSKCRLREPRCEIDYQLRSAMGENYPYFVPEFVRLDLKNIHRSHFEDFDSRERLPESIIVCTIFKSKQLEFAFSE